MQNCSYNVLSRLMNKIFSQFINCVGNRLETKWPSFPDQRFITSVSFEIITDDWFSLFSAIWRKQSYFLQVYCTSFQDCSIVANCVSVFAGSMSASDYRPEDQQFSSSDSTLATFQHSLEKLPPYVQLFLAAAEVSSLRLQR